MAKKKEIEKTLRSVQGSLPTEYLPQLPLILDFPEAWGLSYPENITTGETFIPSYFLEAIKQTSLPSYSRPEQVQVQANYSFPEMKTQNYELPPYIPTSELLQRIANQKAIKNQLPQSNLTNLIPIEQRFEIKQGLRMNELPPPPQFHDQEIMDLINQIPQVQGSQYVYPQPVSTGELIAGMILAGLGSLTPQGAQAAWGGFARGIQGRREIAQKKAYYDWLEGVRRASREIEAIKAKIAQLGAMDEREARLYSARLRALTQLRENYLKFALKLKQLEASKEANKLGKILPHRKVYRLAELSQTTFKNRQIAQQTKRLFNNLWEAVANAPLSDFGETLTNIDLNKLSTEQEETLRQRLVQAINTWFEAIKGGELAKHIDYQKEYAWFQQQAQTLPTLIDWVNSITGKQWKVKTQKEVKEELLQQRQQQRKEFEELRQKHRKELIKLRTEERKKLNELSSLDWEGLYQEFRAQNKGIGEFFKALTQIIPDDMKINGKKVKGNRYLEGFVIGYKLAQQGQYYDFAQFVGKIYNKIQQKSNAILAQTQIRSFMEGMHAGLEEYINQNQK